MKKIFITLSAIALIFTSCTDNGDDNNNNTETSAKVETTKATFGLTANNPKASTTGRDVRRGEISVFIKDIDITATQHSSSPVVGTGSLYSVNQLFHLVDYSMYPNNNYVIPADVPSTFDIDRVALGSNDFKAVTTPNADALNNFYNLLHYADDSNYQSEFERYLFLGKHSIPYVIYKGAIDNQVIAKDTPNNLVFNLSTNQGRLMGGFYFKRVSLMNSYFATVTAKCYSPNGTLLHTIHNYNFTSKEFAFYKWSDDESVAGCYVKYTIELRTIGSSNDTPALNTYEVDGGTVEASTSKYYTYLIDETKVQTTIGDTENIIFNLPTWNENPTVTGKKS